MTTVDEKLEYINKLMDHYNIEESDLNCKKSANLLAIDKAINSSNPQSESGDHES